jgi:uncharacterized protein
MGLATIPKQCNSLFIPYGEDRWIGTGILDGRVVVVIYTEPAGDTVRIISLRKALSYERKNYEQYLKNGLG